MTVKLWKPGRKPTDFSPAGIRARQQRRERINRGLCLACTRKTDGYVLCNGCRREKNKAQRERLAMCRERGICQECGGVSPGAARCVDCAELRKLRPSRSAEHRASEYRQAAEDSKKDRAAWRRAGLCSRCGKKPKYHNGPRMCERHLASHEARLQLDREISAANTARLQSMLESAGDCSVADVARIIGIARESAAKLMRSGRIPGRFMPGRGHGRWRCWKADVLKYKAERDANPGKQRAAALQRRWRK